MNIQALNNLSFGNYETQRKKAHNNFKDFSYMIPEQKLDVLYEKLNKIEENQRIISRNQAEMHQFNVESTYITTGLNGYNGLKIISEEITTGLNGYNCSKIISEEEKQAALNEIDEVKRRVNIIA